MSEANAEQNDVVDQPTQGTEPVQVNEVVVEVEEETQGEWLKFGILAAVLLFTVLIIALLRPVIFGRIVPAVLGEGQPVAPLVETDTEAETIKPDATPEGEAEAVDDAVEPAEQPAADATATAVSPEDTPTEAAPEPEKPEDFPTAVPAQTHTVQPGETLTVIAQRYNVTVQAIVTANSITNPDRVTVGTQLIIPDGQ